MQQLIYEYLRKSGLFRTDSNDLANNSIKVTKDEVVLTGNKLGLIMLADYIVNIALSDAGSHIHLDLDNFFDIADSQLIIELIDA